MKANEIIHSIAWKPDMAALIILASSVALEAQTWQTILDYQLVPGSESAGNGIVADTLGNVFSGGDGYDSVTSNYHGLVLATDATQLAKTDPTAINWFLSDDTNPHPAQYRSDVWDIGVDALGNLYSIGQLWPSGSSGEAFWYVRKSSDGGLNWSTLYEPNGSLYQYTPGQWVYPRGFAADPSGSIYVVGGGRDLTVAGSGKGAKNQSNIHWLVRKSADAGQTWTLVDDIILGQPIADAAAVEPGVGVFVVGAHFYPGPWVVRRSATGDAGTWSTVDGPITNAAAHGVCSDSQGNIYVAGQQFQSTGTVKHQATGYVAWATRMSSNGGNTWATVDTFTLAPNTNACALAVGTDAVGHMVVVGNATDAQGMHWIVRLLGPTGWQTIDNFQLAPGLSTSANAVTVDASGRLLVTGNARDAAGTHWIVRRL
jgi:hypothetical protein